MSKVGYMAHRQKMLHTPFIEFCTDFSNDSEAILSRVSALCPGSQTFPSEKHLEEFANHIHLVKII